MFFLTGEGVKTDRIGVSHPHWTVLDGYSQDRVFLFSRDGYATLEMP